MKEMYLIVRLFTNKNFVPEIVPLLLKNRNQHIKTCGLMRQGAYMWGNSSAKEKVGVSSGGARRGGL